MSRSTLFWTGIGAAAIIAAVLICTSCDQRTYVQASPPVVAQVVPAPAVIVQSHNDGFVSGMLLGHMMSSPTVIHHYPAYVAPRTTIVRNTTIINRSVRVSPPSRSYSSYSSSRSYGSFGRR